MTPESRAELIELYKDHSEYREFANLNDGTIGSAEYEKGLKLFLASIEKIIIREKGAEVSHLRLMGQPYKHTQYGETRICYHIDAHYFDKRLIELQAKLEGNK